MTENDVNTGNATAELGHATAEAERRAIRDAMRRLMDGDPIRSDGKLTIKSLAAEANVKRWVLTHKHKDLQSEFRDRLSTMTEPPAPVRAAMEALTVEQDRAARLASELRQAREEIKRYTRVVQVLTLEKQKLEGTVQDLTKLLAVPSSKRPSN